MEGGCFCGALRYEAQGKPVAKGQCHCRACQQVSGGAPNLFMLMPREGFRYTKGSPKTFRRPDSAAGVTREFCGACGTHVATRRDGLDQVILKIGTLDDPAVYRGPKFALFTAEKQDFHHIPEGVPGFPGFPNGM